MPSSFRLFHSVCAILGAGWSALTAFERRPSDFYSTPWCWRVYPRLPRNWGDSREGLLYQRPDSKFLCAVCEDNRLNDMLKSFER